MSPTLKIGGPLANRCPICEANPGVTCITAPYSLGTRYPLRKPHAARRRNAPPEVEVKAGDFVILHPGPPFPDGLAVLVDPVPAGGLVQVRTWRHDRWGLVVPVHPSVILRLAPEDERTAAARAALEKGNAS